MSRPTSSQFAAAIRAAACPTSWCVRPERHDVGLHECMTLGTVLLRYPTVADLLNPDFEGDLTR